MLALLLLLLLLSRIAEDILVGKSGKLLKSLSILYCWFKIFQAIV